MHCNRPIEDYQPRRLLVSRSLLIISHMKPRILTPLLLLAMALSMPVIAEDPPADAENAAAPNMPAKATGPRTEPDPDAVKVAELAKAYNPSTETIWLDAGEEKALGLYQPRNTEEQNGSVVLFHDELTSADWPDLIRVLRTGLPDKGWATLSVQLPSPPSDELPERTLKAPRELLPPGGVVGTPTQEGKGSEETPEEETAATEAEQAPEETTNEDTAATDEQATDDSALPSYDQRIQNYGSAAVQQLSSEEGELVVLGVGTGAAWAAEFVKEQQGSGNLHLVMVDARQPTAEGSPQLIELLPELTGKVLDLYHTDPLALAPASSEAKARVNLAKRSKLKNYYHNRLPSVAGDRKKRNDWVMTRVRGFMQNHFIDAKDSDESEEGMMNSMESPKSENGPGSTANRS